MKIKNLAAKYLVLAGMIFGLVSCGEEPAPTPDPILHTVRFVSGDTVLQTSQVENGKYAKYTQATPTKDPTTTSVYTFRCWNYTPEINPIYDDTTYVALFTESTRKYEVKFVSEGQILQTSQVEAGKFAKYEGEKPTKEGNIASTYEFLKWDRDPRATKILADTTFTAEFSASTVQYKIKFVNYDGTLLEEKMVDYGAVPTYTGTEPMKANDSEHMFVFNGWDKELASVTGETTYTATFKSLFLHDSIDDFESYKSESTLAEAWQVSKYQTSDWIATTATIKRGFETKLGDSGAQSGLLNMWINSNAFRYRKAISTTKETNGIQFDLLARAEHEITVRVNGTLGGQSAYFDYKLGTGKTHYNGFVTINLPFADQNWKLYGSGNSITAQLGANVTKLPTFLTSIDFIFKGYVDGGPNSYAYIDNLEFVSNRNTSATIVDHATDRIAGFYQKTQGVEVFITLDTTVKATVQYGSNKLSYYYAFEQDGNDLYFGLSANGRTYEAIGLLTTNRLGIDFIQVSSSTLPITSGYKMGVMTRIDNFDQYKTEGKLYSQESGSQNTRSGMRAKYYCDYYSGGSGSPLGGNGWSLMGGSYDQLKLKIDDTTKNQYACLKRGTAGNMRYMTYALYDGSSSTTSFKGNLIAFKAFSKDGAKISGKIIAYSRTKVDASSQGYNRTDTAFTVESSSWGTYTANLTAGTTYYGISIIVNSGSSAGYLYMDDIVAISLYQ